MGDWVANPSNTATRRILVPYFFHAAVCEEGSPEPPSIRMNNFILCSMIIVFRMNNPMEFILCPIIIIFPMLSPSTRVMHLQTKVQVQEALWSHCKSRISSLSHQQKWSLFNDHVQHDRRLASNIDLRARSMCVCVILHISSWRYGHIVILFWCINDDYNLCVWFCISCHEDMAAL
jgi:hypothetical protein